MNYAQALLITVLLLFSLVLPVYNPLVESVNPGHSTEHSAGNSHNVTYGSTYILSSNITILENESLQFENSDIRVLSHGPLWIYDYGSLFFMNSSISQYNSSHETLFIIGEKNSDGNASSISFLNSTLNIDGLIEVYNSSVTVYNSTLRAPGNSSSPLNSMRFIANSSDILIQNSTVTGLFHTSSKSETNAASFNYSGSGPFSTRGFFPMDLKAFASGDVVTNYLLVNLTYSGNSASSQNTVLFMFGNKTFREYALNDTGSVNTLNTAQAKINITNLGLNVSTILKEFRIYFNLSYAYGSNSSIWALSSLFGASDVVHTIGDSYFNYILENSTEIIANSEIGVNSAPQFSEPNLPNPEKNAFSLLGNSTLFMISCSIAMVNASFSPSVIKGGGEFLSFSEITLKPESNNVPVTNYTQCVSPGNLNSSENEGASEAVNLLSRSLSEFNDFDVRYLHSFLTKGLVLTDSLSLSSRNVQTLNYNINIDRQKFTDSMSPFPYNTSVPVVVVLSVHLAKMAVSICTALLFYGTNNAVTIEISDTVYGSGEVLWDFSFSGLGAGSLDNGSFSNIQSGTTQLLNVSIDPGNTELYSQQLLSFSLLAENSTVAGSYVNVSEDVLVYPSIFLNISSNYSWLSGGILSFDANITNNGNQNLSGLEISSTYYSGSSEVENTTFTTSLDGHSSILNESLIYDAYISEIVVVLHPGILLYGNSTLSYTIELKKDTIYNVTFKEHGLPDVSQWSVEVSGNNFSSTSDELTLSLPNGTYRYVVKAPAGYRVNVSEDLFTIDAHSVHVSVNFSIITYAVTLKVSGIPSSSTWTVTIDSLLYNMTGSSAKVYLPNGSYSLDFKTTGHYGAEYRNITVSGSNLTVTVTFLKTHTHPFTDLLHVMYGLRYVISLSAVILFVLLYRYYHGSVKICRKCFTTYAGFGKCPNCKVQDRKNESNR